jgi:hypothetical protein
MWKIIFGFSLAGAIAFLLSAALLASTIRSLDPSKWILDGRRNSGSLDG